MLTSQLIYVTANGHDCDNQDVVNHFIDQTEARGAQFDFLTPRHPAELGRRNMRPRWIGWRNRRVWTTDC